MTAYRLCEMSELAESQPVQVTAGGVRVAVVRVGTEIFVIEDRCSHERAVALSDGEIDASDLHDRMREARQPVLTAHRRSAVTAGH